MRRRSLSKCYEYTADVIRQQMAEFDMQESLIQPYAGGHSINWLLGHIVSARSFPLRLLGQDEVWDEETRARYRNGSKPIGAGCPGVLHIDELKSLFESSQNRLIAGLDAMTNDRLDKPSGYQTNTVSESLLYFHFHETYHVGQLTIIAELLGKRAKYLRL